MHLSSQKFLASLAPASSILPASISVPIHIQTSTHEYGSPTKTPFMSTHTFSNVGCMGIGSACPGTWHLIQSARVLSTKDGLPHMSTAAFTDFIIFISSVGISGFSGFSLFGPMQQSSLQASAVSWALTSFILPASISLPTRIQTSKHENALPVRLPPRDAHSACHPGTPTFR